MNKDITQDNTHEIQDFQAKLERRHRIGSFWQIIFRISTFTGIIALIILLLNIINSAFGYVAIQDAIPPQDLAINGIPIENLHEVDLVAILKENLSAGLIRRLESESAWEDRSRDEILTLVITRVVEPTVEDTWSLYDSVFNKDKVLREQQEKFPESRRFYHVT
jgi:phosphate transport system permease protein